MCGSHVRTETVGHQKLLNVLDRLHAAFFFWAPELQPPAQRVIKLSQMNESQEEEEEEGGANTDVQIKCE